MAAWKQLLISNWSRNNLLASFKREPVCLGSLGASCALGSWHIGVPGCPRSSNHDCKSSPVLHGGELHPLSPGTVSPICSEVGAARGAQLPPCTKLRAVLKWEHSQATIFSSLIMEIFKLLDKKDRLETARETI